MSLLPEVRGQLYTAAERQTKRRSIVGIHLPTMGRRVLGFRPGYLAAAASVLLVLAIVAVFVGVRGSSTSTTSGSGTTSVRVSAVPAGAPAAARLVVAQTAVFRRPQKATDHLPVSVVAQLASLPFRISVIPRLTRLAATVNAAGSLRMVKIYAVVLRSGGYPVDVATTLVVAGRAGHQYLVTPPEVVDEETAIQTGGLTPTAAASVVTSYVCTPRGCRSYLLPGGKGVAVAVVPDGVTRVKWVFNRFPGRRGAAVTVHPRVENNVAVAGIVGGAAGPLDATWYGVDGQVIEPIKVAQHPVPRRPVPAVVGRSFAALRGVPANHAVPIANNIGLRLGLVPHPTQVCFQWMVANAVRSRAGGGDCVPISMALAGEMSPLSGGPAGETVIGLAPNGNRTVRLTVLDRRTKVVSTEVVPVSRNVYFASTPHLFETVTLKDSKGALRTWNVPDGVPR